MGDHDPNRIDVSTLPSGVLTTNGYAIAGFAERPLGPSTEVHVLLPDLGGRRIALALRSQAELDSLVCRLITAGRRVFGGSES